VSDKCASKAKAVLGSDAAQRDVQRMIGDEFDSAATECLERKTAAGFFDVLAFAPKVRL